MKQKRNPNKRVAKKPSRKPAKFKKFGKKGGAASRKKKPPRKAPRPFAGSKVAPPENPRAKALAQRIAQLVLEKKAADVVILDVRGKTSYADYFIIASGESDRQVSAMAEHVETSLKQEGEMKVGSEGYETGQWVLLDYGEVVAHFFYNEVRAFYDLEGLWADASKEKVA
jgi:ribosome-associated protein